MANGNGIGYDVPGSWLLPLVSIGLVVGLGILLGLAPRAVIRGEADSWRQALIGYAGILIWIALIAGVVGVWP